MKNKDCDIVNDLIPSYVDGICSDATKEYVEGHTQKCESCRQMRETYKDNVLSGEKLEQRGMDGLKKIRTKMKYQNLVCYLVLVFLVYCGVQVFFANHTNYIIFGNTTLLLVICILANLLASFGYKARNRPGKIQYLLGVRGIPVEADYGEQVRVCIRVSWEDKDAVVHEVTEATAGRAVVRVSDPLYFMRE